ncbi:MAG: carboxypeptidase regulatory-like domain-containing protein, partial [Acidobacteriaceae bacterium]|nr:carboxypeptidase regulatory-like domain-containing protein [Acidobacteriaceae bacterium]
MIRLLLFAFSVACLCKAQLSSGSITGNVSDPAGAAVPATRVTALELSTGAKRSTMTTIAGVYRIDELAPGKYEVSAEHSGFGLSVASPIVVEIDQKTRFDFRLQPGVNREQVTVNAAGAPLQTDEASEGYLLSSQFSNALPVNGRNVISLVTLGPGAIPRQLGGFGHDIINDLQAGRGAVALNPPVNGARSTTNAYLLDGSNNTDRNTFAIAVTPPMDAVAEFRIQSS